MSGRGAFLAIVVVVLMVIAASMGWWVGQLGGEEPPYLEPPLPRADAPEVLDWKTPGPCLGWVDGDGGAPVDGFDDSVWRFVYDDRGALTSIFTDYGPDGEPDAQVSFELDEDGRAIAETYDCDVDGTPEERFAYFHDDLGRRRVGVLDKVQGHESECFAPIQAEKIERHVSPAEEQYRRDWEAILIGLGAGLPELEAWGAVQYLHDEDGLRTTEEWDMDGNGVVEEVIHFHHDPYRNLVWEYHDDGPDGVIDVSVRFDHSCWTRPVDLPPAQPCGGEWDLDENEETDGFTRHYLDDQGRIVRVHADWNDDGELDNRFFYTYDAQGRRITEEWDTELDGGRAEVLTIVYEGDRRIRGNVDEGGDGTVDGTATYEYDAQGRMVKELWDKDGDGEVDEVLSHEYGADGRKTTSFYDDLKQVQPDETVRWLYDCRGLRVP